MPRNQRPLKSIVVEAAFVVVVLTIVGHLSVNFWERCFIQSELAQVKASLHNLKKTLSNIGYAYDNLHRELSVILNMEQINKTLATLPRSFPTPLTPAAVEFKLRNKNTIDRRRLHDIQVNTALTSVNVKKDKPSILKKYYKENTGTQSMPDKHATTITNDCLKAAAVEADLSHENCRHHKHYHTNTKLDDICEYNRIKDKLQAST